MAGCSPCCCCSPAPAPSAISARRYDSRRRLDARTAAPASRRKAAPCWTSSTARWRSSATPTRKATCARPIAGFLMRYQRDEARPQPALRRPAAGSGEDARAGHHRRWRADPALQGPRAAAGRAVRTQPDQRAGAAGARQRAHRRVRHRRWRTPGRRPGQCRPGHLHRATGKSRHARGAAELCPGQRRAANTPTWSCWPAPPRRWRPARCTRWSTMCSAAATCCG